MKLLYVAATEFEISPFLKAIPGIEFLITGIGVPATIYQLCRRVNLARYDLVIQAGVGGSFGSMGIGEVAFISSDCFADLAVRENEVLHTLFEKDFLDKNEFPFTNATLDNPIDFSRFLKIANVKAITVNQLTDDVLYSRQMQEKFSADIESMEGAAFHYVCLQEKIPFVQIRSVSNMVGVRDKSQWKLSEAIKVLNLNLIELHEMLNASGFHL